MGSPQLPEWEYDLVDDAIRSAEERLEEERAKARKRAVQLAREQGYHRLALEIDRPAGTKPSPDQLTLFPIDLTLFDQLD